MPNQTLRVIPIMDELLLYGKRLLRIKKDTNIYVGKSAGGI